MPHKGSKKAKKVQDGRGDSPAMPASDKEASSNKVPENLCGRLAWIESVLADLATKADKEQPQPPTKRRVTTRQNAADLNREC